MVLLSLAAQTVLSADRLPLVDVLCEYLSVNSVESLKDDEQWKRLSENLEKRNGSADHLPSILTKPDFTSCVTRLAPEMDLGEFILIGRETLEESREPLPRLAEAPTQAPLMLTTSVTLAVEDRNLSTPEFSIPLAEETYSPNPASEERHAARMAHYNSLWNSFLDVLRKRLTH